MTYIFYVTKLVMGSFWWLLDYLGAVRDKIIRGDIYSHYIPYLGEEVYNRIK